MKKHKKLLLYSIIFLILVGFICTAQQLYIGDNQELSWDSEPDPVNGSLMYEVCVMDREDGGDPIVVDEVIIPPVTVNISTYNFEVTFGVRTVLTLSEDAMIEGTQYEAGDRVYSNWNFSDVNGESTPNPFVASRGVHAPGNFRRQ
ncbi:MAG TPA: hypothetical protein VMW53_11180 [archaeon]|nr:hypothetical protein [archaeon]